MSAPMKKPHTDDIVHITVHGKLTKEFTITRSDSPKLIGFLQSLQSSLLNEDKELYTADEVFKDIYKKHGKVGSAIRGFRFRDGLTQKDLAKMLEIHQVHISQIENGKRVVGKKLAHKLAEVFHTNYRLFL